MKNKKSLAAITAILLIAVVGVTFAYFNSSATFQNRFNIGNYNVVTTEVFESPDNWSPGDTIIKTIKVKNEGTIPAAVRISMAEEWTDANDQELTDIPNDAIIINFTTPSDWTKNGEYYYYNYFLEPNNETTNLIESVTLNSNLSESICTTENGVQTCISNMQGLNGAHYTLTFTIETVQYDKYQEIWETNQTITEPIDPVVYTTRQIENAITIGDVITIGTEDFYVINTNENITNLIAKYNLNVGNTVSKYYTMHPYGEYPIVTPISNPTGIQDANSGGFSYSKCVGMDGIEDYSAADWDYECAFQGTVPFSTSNTWKNKNYELLSINGYYYYPLYEEATIKNYVDDYIEYLENYKTGLTGRLITYPELTALGCACNDTCPYSWLESTSYWIGDASDYLDNDYTTIWHMPMDNSKSAMQNGGPVEVYSDDYAYGVRPVITIATDEIINK